MELKYTYKEDQWSPLNPEGKIQYDRNFLLQLQFVAESVVKPAGLPKLPDVILDAPYTGRSGDFRGGCPSTSPDFTPSFFRQSSRDKPYTGRSGDFRGDCPSTSPDFTPSFFRQSSRDKVTPPQMSGNDIAAQFAAQVAAMLSSKGQAMQRQAQAPDGDTDKRAPAAAAAPAATEHTTEYIEKKTKSLIDEYLQIHDMKEAIQCVKELESPKSIHHFVSTCLNHVLERSSKARTATGSFLNHLVKQNIVSADVYMEGLQETLEFAEDMEIDIPMIWQYLGELIGPMVQDGCLPLSFQRRIRIVAAILHDMSRTKLDNELDRLIVVMNVDNEKVIDWVEANVGESHVKEPAFIRALMTAICTSAITGEGTQCRVDDAKVKKRLVLLLKYLDHKETLELQALYALQTLVHRLEHPPSVLRTFVHTFYDEIIISVDAFIQWEDSSDPAEQAGKGVGKGVAMNSLKPFFDWLNYDESDYDS